MVQIENVNTSIEVNKEEINNYILEANKILSSKNLDESTKRNTLIQ